MALHINQRVGFATRGFANPVWVPSADGTLPKIHADFAKGVYFYNGHLYPTLATWLTALSGTFTRASTAYRTNASGLLESVSTDVLRFDYDPVTLLSKGILLEGARTNLVLWSQEFDNASWGKINLTATADGTTGPDGTTTADLLSDDNANGIHYVPQTFTFGAAAYAFSVYAKKNAGAHWLYLNTWDGAADRGAYFNIDAGTVGTLVGGATAIIEALPNGWYRCSTVRTASAGAGDFSINVANGDGVRSYQGATANSIYVWGAQLE